MRRIAGSSASTFSACANEARSMKIEVAMKNNFGFGGTNGTLLFRRA